MARFRKGQWYVVEFWDHVMGMDKPVKCRVAGQVLKLDKLSVTLTWWEVLDKDYSEDNHEMVTLLRSTLVSVKPLKFPLKT